jgi:hypothetical protein
MKRTSLLVATTAMLGALVLSSSASAAVDHPSKAKSLKATMVTAYNQCVVGTGTLTHRPSLALESCVPVATSATNPADILSFGPKGETSIALSVKTGDVAISAKGKDVLNNGSPFSGNVTGNAIVRATDNGCGALFDTDCTLINIPFPVVTACAAGACSVKTTANTVLANAVHAGDLSNIEVGQISISDPNGDHAARQGLYVP